MSKSKTKAKKKGKRKIGQVFFKDGKSFNRFNDAFIKFLLSKKEHKAFLLDFVNAVFYDQKPACIKGKIIDLHWRNREITPQNITDKQIRFDIKATTDQGQIIDIEVQSNYQVDLEDRDVFYCSKIFGTQAAKRGGAYSDLKPVILINILAFNKFRWPEYHSQFVYYNKEHNHVLSDKCTIIFLEAQKCDHLSIKNRKRLVRWLKYFTNFSPVEVEDLAKQDLLFAEILEAEKMFVNDELEMEKHEAVDDYYRKLASVKKAGIIEGEKKNADEIKKRDKIIKEKDEQLSQKDELIKMQHQEKLDRDKKLISSIKNLLNTGVSLKQVIESFNLTPEQIVKLNA